MNIAIVTAGINTHSGLRAPIELGLALKNLGHQVTFYAPTKRRDPWVIHLLTKNGIKIKLIRENGFLQPILELRNKIKDNNHDLISAHCFFSQLLAARLTGVPLIWTYYGTQLHVLAERTFPRYPLWLKLAEPLANQLIRLRTWLMTRMADDIVPISRAATQDLISLYGRKPSATIPLGSAPEKFTKQSDVLSLNVYPERSRRAKRCTLLSVSRLTPYKGFHLLIDAVDALSHEIPDIHLVIVGSAPLPKYLRYLQERAGNHVTIKVNASDKELASLYSLASVYATADEYLFFGLPIWEAASFGIPTVALNRQAAAEAVIHGKTGFLAKNEAELARYLKILLTDSRKREKLGRQARKRALNHTWKKTADHYANFFNAILKRTYQPLVPETLITLFQTMKAKTNSFKLADLGTGEGIYLKLLEKSGYLETFQQVVAIDKHPQLSQFHKQLKVIPADLSHMPKVTANAVDIALCIQVIEHLENQAAAMQEIFRILKPGGKLYISSVAKRWYALYWHRNARGQISLHPGHIHEFRDLQEFRLLIESAGFKILSATQTPGKFPFFDYLLRLQNLILRGTSTSKDHRDIYLKHPRLIPWQRRFSMLPLPGYSSIEALAQKP